MLDKKARDEEVYFSVESSEGKKKHPYKGRSSRTVQVHTSTPLSEERTHTGPYYDQIAVPQFSPIQGPFRSESDQQSSLLEYKEPAEYLALLNQLEQDFERAKKFSRYDSSAKVSKQASHHHNLQIAHSWTIQSKETDASELEKDLEALVQQVESTIQHSQARSALLHYDMWMTNGTV